MPEVISKAFVALLLALCAAQATAKEAAPEAADPALEARMTRITAELRCLVCQNQTIADSQADLAVDLRQQVREKLGQGMSEREVADYLVQRYGDFVLYRPPVKPATWLLWGGPLLLLAAGIIALGLRLLRPRAQDALSPEQQSRSARLLGTGDEPPAGTS
jgi:cytochrome c-type biogenesis protein CcmH